MNDELDLTTYLTGKGIQVYRAAGSEITSHCFFCPDGDTKGKGKLYFNTESWLWDCKRCGEKGNRKTLLRHFGDSDKLEYLPGSDPGARRRVLSAAADLAADMLLANPAILDYLSDRGIKTQTILDYRLGYVPKGWSLTSSLRGADCASADLIAAGVTTQSGHDFFLDRITIPYLSHGDVIQLRGKDPKGKYFTPAGDSVRLFNADRLHGAEDVIITEGEFDCLVLQQELECSTNPKLRTTAVVGIPGAQSLPANFDSYFSHARRVYIALDPDDTGTQAALKIKAMLGSKARIVELPAALPKCDWTEYLRPLSPEHPHGGHTWRDVQELLAIADSLGRRLWTVSDAAHEWRRITDEVGGIKTGFTELDAWIQPGIKPGQLVVPLAKTGVGKTNFLCNLVYYTRMRPTLFITLEQTRSEMYERLRKIYHFWEPRAADHEVEAAYSHLRIVDENRLTEGAIQVLCDEFTEEVGVRPQLVLVDYLGYFAKGCRGRGSYEQTTAAVMTLKEEAKAAGVALVSPHQVNRTAENGRPLEASDARDSGAVEETADIMLSLYRPGLAVATQAGLDNVPSANVRLGCLKNRNGAAGSAANLVYSAASLVLVDANTPAARKVEDENADLYRGMTYAEIRAKQSAGQQLRLLEGGIGG